MDDYFTDPNANAPPVDFAPGDEVPDFCRGCPYNDADADICAYPGIGCAQWNVAASPNYENAPRVRRP